jgi:hypothetical protein
MILVASVLYNVPQENQAVDQLPPLLHPLVHLNHQAGKQPKGEEEGVVDLLSGFPVAHCTRQMPLVSC